MKKKATMPAVLIVDDDPMMLRYLRSLLECEGYTVTTVPSGASALHELRAGSAPALVLLDMHMSGMDGLDTLDQLQSLSPNAKVVMISGENDPSAVVQAIKAGAVDYLVKPLDEERLLSILRHHAPTASADEDAGLLIEDLGGDSFFLASSDAMRNVHQQVERIARFDVPVLITGESGTGKEIVALLLHKHSQRSAKRFLKVNCAAIPEELLESELFGYEAGAFTGASTSKPGYFEQCNHGTILLDEIGEMPPRLQAKLLQVLQEQKFFRLGGRQPISVDVRILAATNINVKQAIEQGSFRLDLYYRLNAFSIALPALRERHEEILPLFRHFMKRLAYAYQHPPRPLTPAVEKSLLCHCWPGNLRELHNVVKRYLVLGEGLTGAPPVVSPTSIAARSASGFGQATANAAALAADPGSLKKMVRQLKGEAEAEAIRNALEQTQWRRKEAAELLGICYKALIYKSRQYGITSPRSKVPPKSAPAPLAEVDIMEQANPGGNSRYSALRAVGMEDTSRLR